ncbi:DUF5028 domain-containing protein [Gracilibacillus saliphilus]|uniref:DUF5028 domain-containing protein n=1 Tax=Gracilibacillus saliphilus TaxID=543890 RepID=UPI0013D318ED|nr:DUF5028 domain-containing protein [Gracilibacillus saliphilus]
MNGYTVTVNSAEILSYQAYISKYNLSKNDVTSLFENLDMSFPEMIYDVELTITNTNISDNEEEHSGINFIHYHLNGTDFSLQISDPLYLITNDAGNLMDGFRLRPKTEMGFHLPFYYPTSTVSDSLQTDAVLNDEVYLVVSLYPTVKQILIDFNET